MAYNKNNVFARILRGELPAQKVFENDYILAFNDINPKAPVHVLVIPKGEYASSTDFYENAPDHEIASFYRGLREVIGHLELETTGGFRLMSNYGTHGGQEVEHFHVHIFGGKNLGPMLAS